jgi:hypothetical protein
MKSGRFFWAALFIILGILGLLNNLSIMTIQWNSVWKFWPLIFILLGLSAILKNEKTKWALVACVGAVTGIVIFAAVHTGVGNVHDVFSDDDVKYSRQTLIESFDASTTRASFVLRSGAGSFTMEDTTGDLATADIKTSIGLYEMIRDTVDGIPRITLSKEGKGVSWSGRKLKNRVDVRLNPVPEWDMTFEVGAASAELDLRPYKTKNIVIQAGASSLDLKLGNRADESRLKIETGASSISIDIPAGVDCEINTDTELSSRNFEGFDEIDKHMYRSKGYGSSSKKMYISIDAGVSSINVERHEGEW